MFRRSSGAWESGSGPFLQALRPLTALWLNNYPKQPLVDFHNTVSMLQTSQVSLSLLLPPACVILVKRRAGILQRWETPEQPLHSRSLPSCHSTERFIQTVRQEMREKTSILLEEAGPCVCLLTTLRCEGRRCVQEHLEKLFPGLVVLACDQRGMFGRCKSVECSLKDKNYVRQKKSNNLFYFVTIYTSKSLNSNHVIHSFIILFCSCLKWVCFSGSNVWAVNLNSCKFLIQSCNCTVAKAAQCAAT